MARPANQQTAAREASALLARSLPGSRRGTVRAHIHRAEHIADAIWRRWQVSPHQWQVKHVRCYLTIQVEQHGLSTRYRCWLTVRALTFALGKAEYWLPHPGAPGFVQPESVAPWSEVDRRSFLANPVPGCCRTSRIAILRLVELALLHHEPHHIFEGKVTAVDTLDKGVPVAD
jgi:hypothetical protein